MKTQHYPTTWQLTCFQSRVRYEAKCFPCIISSVLTTTLWHSLILRSPVFTIPVLHHLSLLTHVQVRKPTPTTPSGTIYGMLSTLLRPLPRLANCIFTRTLRKRSEYPRFANENKGTGRRNNLRPHHIRPILKSMLYSVDILTNSWCRNSTSENNYNHHWELIFECTPHQHLSKDFTCINPFKPHHLMRYCF